MKKILVPTAALAAAVVILVALALPPTRLALTTARPDDTVPGTIHVHTRRSDGRGTPDDIAEAAARQGLKFVVLTDHGDGTREPDAPVYRSGVLLLDAVEISTIDGHYVALGMGRSPYPLNGEARDVVEDVRRLGGWGIAAHPESPKPGLSWRAWDTPFDAIEWANPDTSWRVRIRQSRWDILQALASYPFRPAETMARLMGGTTLDPVIWARLAQRRPIVIAAGADAHARLGFGSDPGDGGLSLPIPSYDASFRTLSVHVLPERPLNGNASSDAASILNGLRRGHAYVAIDGLASPPAFLFTAGNGREVASAGDALPAGNTTFTIDSNAPRAWTTNLWSGEKVVASAPSSTPLTYRTDAPGVYRAEIVATSSSPVMPWIVSNLIYVGVTFSETTPVQRAAVDTRSLVDGRTTSGWWTEHDAASVASLDLAATASSASLRLRYELRGGSPSGQFVALAVKAPNGPPYERVRFSIRGEQSGRLEVQVRGPIPSAERWQRSVYFDQSDRTYSINFSDMTPIGPVLVRRPSLADVRDILFVLDTTHTSPGSSGSLWITSPSLEK